MTYKRINCRFCNKEFEPTSSRSKHCCAQCRFREIAKQFENVDGCWEWTLSKNIATGYGQFSVSCALGYVETAHRYSYEIFTGSVPTGSFVCHHCDNRACFNPKHLFVGTAADNSADMVKKGRQQHCGNKLSGAEHPLARNPSLAHRKLTAEMATAVLVAQGSERAIAKRLGLARGTIRAIRNRQTWKHLKTDTLNKIAATK